MYLSFFIQWLLIAPQPADVRSMGDKIDAEFSTMLAEVRKHRPAFVKYEQDMQSITAVAGTFYNYIDTDVTEECR